jgi:recombination protein RecA
MGAVLSLDALVTQLGARIDRVDRALHAAPCLPLGWDDVDALLPDGGLPCGVIELVAPRVLGGVTRLCLSAVRAAQARDGRAWCAWLDPEGTLYAPGAAKAGVDLARLFVVRPERSQLGRIAVKVAASGAFDVVVVDLHPVGEATVTRDKPSSRGARQPLPLEIVVRRLALASEERGATVLLATDARVSRAVSWPVALRLEMARPNPAALTIRVAKDKRGRIGQIRTIDGAFSR